MSDISTALTKDRALAEGTGNLALRNTIQRAAFALTWIAAGVSVALLVWIIGYVIINGAQVIDLELLTTRPKGGVSGEGGISTTIPTTIYLVVFTLALAGPLGIGAAVYLVEYAYEVEKESRAARNLIRISRTGIEILAGK